MITCVCIDDDEEERVILASFEFLNSQYLDTCPNDINWSFDTMLQRCYN